MLKYLLAVVILMLATLLAPRPIFGEAALPRVKIGGKYGFINKVGEIVIKPQFDDAGSFSK